MSSYTLRQLDHFTEAVDQWQKVCSEAERLQEMLSDARTAGWEPIGGIETRERAADARAEAARLLDEAVECMSGAHPATSSPLLMACAVSSPRSSSIGRDLFSNTETETVQGVNCAALFQALRSRAGSGS